ncbi:hypothetical protein M0802_001913 [Mischocyttarus mexicanus]|nr:hypothetical protein M0802_001913 [Mischocyttarus mexicanus]
MNENEICNILTRIQEIEKLQKELRNLLPNATNNRINIEKSIENTNLKRKSSSSTIRFPSLLTFSGITEQSNVRKYNGVQSSKEILRSSVMNMNNIQLKKSVKNVNPSKRGSLNITISDSSGKLHPNNNKDLPKILENSVKTRPKNLQSYHSKSMLNNKKTFHSPTISEKIVNSIPKIQDSKKSVKHQLNHSKLLNVNENRKDQNKDKSLEYKKKSNLSSVMEFTIDSCPQTSDMQSPMEKFEKNRGMFVCQGNQSEIDKSSDIFVIIKKGGPKLDIFEKILKRLGYCILDDHSISSIGCYSNDKTRYFTLRKMEKLSEKFITNEGQETDDILSSIKEIIICTNTPTNHFKLDRNFSNNVAGVYNIIKKFNGIDKVSKILKMSLKENKLSEILRHSANRSIEMQDNSNNNNPLCLNFNRNSRFKSLETIDKKSSSKKKYSLKFFRKICFCMNF